MVLCPEMTFMVDGLSFFFLFFTKNQSNQDCSSNKSVKLEADYLGTFLLYFSSENLQIFAFVRMSTLS